MPRTIKAPGVDQKALANEFVRRSSRVISTELPQKKIGVEVSLQEALLIAALLLQNSKAD